MFDSNRAALGALYQEASYLTFEGTKLQGVAAIVQKLTSLPFQARAVDAEAWHARARPSRGPAGTACDTKCSQFSLQQVLQA